MLQFFKSQISSLFAKQTANSAKCSLEQVRTRITCSRTDGKEKSVKTAMHRYFRLNKLTWIRAQPGLHHHLYFKPAEKRYILQQPVICGKAESKMMERMAGRFYKNLKIEQFVDPPFVHYHDYLTTFKSKKQKMFP